MKKLLPILLMLAATPAFSAIEYEFQQSARSDVDQVAAHELSGRALVDGSNYRVDFLSGNVYPPGTYAISNDASRTVRFVDPMSKSYTEINSAAMMAALGAGKISVTNLLQNVEHLPDHPIVAGVTTEHYRLTLSYDITVTFRSMPLSQSVRTEIDKWTTLQYGDVVPTFLGAGGIRTGNAKIDDLIEMETSKVAGFPMRQTVKITTKTNRAQIEGSELKFSPVRNISRDMVVTRIRETNPATTAFLVPASFHKAEQADVKQTQVQVLSIVPDSK
jgi:hypothetical protein